MVVFCPPAAPSGAQMPGRQGKEVSCQRTVDKMPPEVACQAPKDLICSLQGKRGDSMEELKDRIAAARKLAGLTQEQLGELLGVTRQAVSKWESGVSYN